MDFPDEEKDYDVYIKYFRVESNKKKFCVKKNKKEEAKENFLVLPKGPVMNSKIGLTPLHWACIRLDLNLVKELLIGGANINEQSFEGWTPLHYAVVSNDLDLITFLLKEGAGEEQYIPFDFPLDINFLILIFCCSPAMLTKFIIHSQLY